MSCLACSRRRLGNPWTVVAIRELVKQKMADIIFLVETLSCGNKIQEIKNQIQFDACFVVDRLRYGGGLVALWRSHQNCSILGFFFKTILRSPYSIPKCYALETDLLLWLLREISKMSNLAISSSIIKSLFPSMVCSWWLQWPIGSS